MREVKITWICAVIFLSVFWNDHSLIAQIKGNKKQVVSDTLDQTPIHINRIYIIGNKKTKRSIITRELSINEGDSVPTYRLPMILEDDKNKVYNTQLFNTVKIEKLEIDSTEIDNTKDIRYGNGKFSDYELFENNSSILKLVEKDLTDIIKQAVNSDIFIIDSFFNILRTGSGLASHHHINDFDRKHKLSDQKYSLTYYLCVGDQNCNEPGILKLYEPNEEILPSEGTIVIFPANRYHSAVYGGKTDRLMIGVNFYSLI